MGNFAFVVNTPVTSFINKAKMAMSVTTVWMFVYFGLVWLKLRRKRRSRRMRALYKASRRHMAALHAEEEEARIILCVLLTRRIFDYFLWTQAIEVIRGFEEVWGFLQCFGAIDGSHILILAPHGSATEYYNKKGQHSIVLQALVDHDYFFMNTYIGCPGSVHDARVLSNSEVFAKGESGTLAPSSVKQICGVHVPVVILGDPAYPLLTWLMKPYTGTGLSQEQRRFNYRLSRARIVVECAFGRLKGRWRSLLKRSDVRVDFMSTVVTSCCILHNVCEVHKDGFDEEWLDEVVISESINATGANPAQHSSTAVAIRNALCTHIHTHQLTAMYFYLISLCLIL